MASRQSPRASGRLLLRLPPHLHAALQSAARAQGFSLNEFLVRRLTAPATSLSATDGATAVVGRAAELLGPALVGVVVYGSWARGEVSDASDVDVLVVLDRGVALDRALYRRWDTAPVSWQGRSVDPHFVHLPRENESVAGVWGEVAVDGVVLFERDDRLSARLVRVRRAIAEGRLVRRTVHGQTYWKGTA